MKNHEKKQEIKIDDEFKQLIPPLTDDEYNKLKELIASDGCLTPLILWDNILLDGHNRYRICNDLGVIFKTVNKNFSTRDEAKIWILENQLGRRNLNDAQHIDITDKLFGLQEKNKTEQERRENISHFRKTGETKANLPSSQSRDKLAKKAKVSPRQYSKGIKIKTKNTELWKKCLSGDMSIDKASKTIDAEEKQKNKELKAAEGERIKITDENIDFRLGDFREILKDIPDGSVDLIITDPPYDKESVYLYEELAKLAKRVLKKNGFCITYAGCMFLPDILNLMNSHLDYYWMFSLVYPKAKTRVMGRNILQGWKPFLVFQNGFKRKEEFFNDVVHGSGREKFNHPWEQSMDELTGMIEYFTKKGESILDPMAGSGSTLIISKKLKRKVIGCEIDEQTYNAAKKRINESNE